MAMEKTPYTVKVGERLANIRNKRGLGQTQAAESAGISRRTLISYEQGERMPCAEKIARLAILYHVKTDWLLCVNAGGHLVKDKTVGEDGKEKVTVELRLRVDNEPPLPGSAYIEEWEEGKSVLEEIRAEREQLKELQTRITHLLGNANNDALLNKICHILKAMEKED